MDGFINFDELQLTYYRNITDTTGNEPCYFFKILEVEISAIVLIIHFVLTFTMFCVDSFSFSMHPTRDTSSKTIAWKYCMHVMEGELFQLLMYFSIVILRQFGDSGFLEREMKLLFGSKLRAEGGDGTLNLEQ